MKKLFIKTSLIIFSFIVLISCRVKKDFSSPINTLTTLQKAINRKSWIVAGLCFTEEVRTMNRQFIDKKEFYFMNTGTLECLLANVPVLSKDARFKIKQLDNEKAIVDIFYPNIVGKDGRLKQLTLIKNSPTEWKVDKISWKTQTYSKFF